MEIEENYIILCHLMSSIRQDKTHLGPSKISIQNTLLGAFYFRTIVGIRSAICMLFCSVAIFWQDLVLQIVARDFTPMVCKC